MIINIDGNLQTIDNDGCGSHGCSIKKPTGQATNGGCSCFDKIPKKDRLEIKRKVFAKLKHQKAVEEFEQNDPYSDY